MTDDDKDNKKFYNRMHYGFEENKAYELLLKELELESDDDDDDIMIGENY